MIKKSLIVGIICAFIVGLFISLKPVFAGDIWVYPAAFSVGSIEIRWYGLLIGISLALGFYLAGRRIKKIDQDDFDIIAWWSVILGVVGARLFYVVQNIHYYQTFPDDILKITEGGLSIHGAIFGGLLGAYLAVGKDFKKLFRFTDAAVPALLLGMIIGRFGNFFNYEIFGYPTNLPWKMFVPEVLRPGGFTHNEFFHPTFLYDAMLNLIVGIVLLTKEKNYQLGELTLKFFIGISITRFIVEFFRIGDPLFAGLTLGQIFSIAVFVVSLAFLKNIKSKTKTD